MNAKIELQERTEKVKAYALSLGFDLVGITAADPLEENGKRFAVWLADGYAGEMCYMARDPKRRTDPRALMPEARSVISLALNYYNGNGDKADSKRLAARVARYAWGEDYHRIIEEKLELLVGFIGELGGRCARERGDVDHGPILERALARRAGLGFIGKNTMLITERFGSWVFLAEVITDLELVPDSPVEGTDGCGGCRLCLDACPTGALVGPYRLDSRRCIAYLTIEKKGEIPEDLRPLVGEWGFGCDLCQEVCPYNRIPVETREERLWPEQGVGPRLYATDLTPKAFKQKLAATPLPRAKRKGLLRNIAVALGNTGEAKDLPALVPMLDDPEPMVREHAAWGLREIARREDRA
jgi:epoxyqueuosine reductase